MALVEVARLDALPQRAPTVVQAGERELVLVRVDDQVYALRDSCPHMAVSFAGGAVVPYAAGTPDEPRFDDEQPVLTCPWHQYEFQLSTGACLTAERLSARTYAVTVRDGGVLVDLASHAPAARSSRPRTQ